MWNGDALRIPDSSFPEATYTLSQDILAMQLVSVVGAEARLGPILRLPKSTTIDVFGEGFNERTLKIRHEGSFYFVFLVDFEKVTADDLNPA